MHNLLSRNENNKNSALLIFLRNVVFLTSEHTNVCLSNFPTFALLGFQVNDFNLQKARFM